MIRVQESVEINRPVEEVFSYTTDPEHLSEWAATVREVRRDSPGRGPLREGGRFTAKQQALGRRFEAPFEVITYEPNQLYAHRGREGHPVPVTMVFAYERLYSHGTRFTPRIEADFLSAVPKGRGCGGDHFQMTSMVTGYIGSVLRVGYGRLRAELEVCFASEGGLARVSRSRCERSSHARSLAGSLEGRRPRTSQPCTHEGGRHLASELYRRPREAYSGCRPPRFSLGS